MTLNRGNNKDGKTACLRWRGPFIKDAPLLRYLEYAGKTQRALNYSLDRMGLCGGFSSSPKLPLNDVEQVKVGGLLQGLGIVKGL
jgi:hypothetical protein